MKKFKVGDEVLVYRKTPYGGGWVTAMDKIVNKIVTIKSIGDNHNGYVTFKENVYAYPIGCIKHINEIDNYQMY